jgi:cytochrome c oxidase assembly factor CtaG
MKGWVSVVIGVLLVLAGTVWALQGLDVLGGSAMSGNRMWAIIGPIVALAGLVLLILGSRWVRRGSESRP